MGTPISGVQKRRRGRPTSTRNVTAKYVTGKGLEPWAVNGGKIRVREHMPMNKREL